MTAPLPLDPGASPFAFFGAELRRLRMQAKLTQQELGLKISYTASLIGLIEHAHRVPTLDFARRCDDILTADGLLVRLWDLVSRSGGLPVGPAELERTTRQVRVFGGLAVPRLLQTPDYSRAVFSARGDCATPEQIDEEVARLAERQLILDRAPCWFVLDQSVLLRPIGAAGVMRGQLDRLAQVATLPTAVLQVVPLGAGAFAGLDGAMTLLSLDDGSEAGFVDGYQYSAIDLRALPECRHAFDLIRAAALSPADSLTMIEAALRDLPRSLRSGLESCPA